MSKSSSSAGNNNPETDPAAPLPHRSPRRTVRRRTVFITGTDTGVGKTVVTGWLLHFLRCDGRNALAVKPFATGDRADALELNRLQADLLTLDEVNPFFFRLPMAPWVAAQFEHPQISLARARAAIAAIQPRADTLLVEGCGGLLAPLGQGYTLVEVMHGAANSVLVVGANRLGVINHARLTIERLRRMQPLRLHFALVDISPLRQGDPARDTNLAVLRELLAPVPVTSIPYLGTSPLPLSADSPAPAELHHALAELVQAIK